MDPYPYRPYYYGNVYDENVHLSQRLYAEEEYCERREARHKRNLKNAKTRVKEEGKQEGLVQGRLEGHEEAMKEQQIYDAGMREGESRSTGHSSSQRDGGSGSYRGGNGSQASRAASKVASAKGEMMDNFLASKSGVSSARGTHRPSPPAYGPSSSRGPSRSAGLHSGWGSFSQQARPHGYSSRQGQSSRPVNPDSSASQLHDNFLSGKGHGSSSHGGHRY